MENLETRTNAAITPNREGKINDERGEEADLLRRVCESVRPCAAWWWRRLRLARWPFT